MNIQSSNFNNILRKNMEKLEMHTHKLSTGKRINQAGNDAAGLSISTRLTSQIRGTAQSIRNIQDGLSTLRTTEGSLGQMQEMVQKMRELVVQGKNGTYDIKQKSNIEGEIKELIAGINQISNTTTFNGINVLSKGSSVNLDGIEDSNHKVTISGIPVVTTPGAKTTVEFWMKWDGEDPGTNQNQIPFGWDGAYDLIINYAKFGINTARGEKIGVNTDSLEDTWTHVSVSFINGVPKPNNTTLYLNGEKQDVIFAAGSTSANRKVTDTIHIGGWGNDDLYDFNGSIDELKIWKGTRTEEQVKESMYNPSIGNEDNLIGYWKLDDNNLKDETNNQNNGSFINGGYIGEGISKSLTIHTGNQADSNDSISLMSVNEILNLKNFSMSDENALSKLDNALDVISKQRGYLGAKMNQFEYKIQNSENLKLNTETAKMRIEDVNMADSLSEITKEELKMSTVQKMISLNNSFENEQLKILMG